MWGCGQRTMLIVMPPGSHSIGLQSGGVQDDTLGE